MDSRKASHRRGLLLGGKPTCRGELRSRWHNEVIAILSLTAAALQLTSCASVSGFPNDPENTSAVLASLQPYFDPSIDVQYYAESDAAKRRLLRDMIVINQIRGYDIVFANFERELYGNGNGVAVGGDLAILALNGFGAVAGVAATKAALAAASAGVLGAQGAINKDLYYQRTIPALLAQMDANRTNAKTTIMVGLKQGDLNYSLPQAYIDLGTLRNAGGIPGAISNVTQAASQNAENAAQDYRQALTGSFSTTSSSQRLRRWADESDANFAALTQWVKKNFPSSRATRAFIDLPQFESGRLTAITAFHVP
jgi:hypothetical protein